MRGGYYRPMWLHRVARGLDGGGAPVAWRHTIVGQSIVAGTPFEAMMVKNGIDQTSVEGAADSPYVEATPNHLVDLHSPRTAVPVLWWRSVGHTHTAFVMETFIDELAHAAKQDPLEYRRKLLKDHPRHLGVLDLAAEKAGWGEPLPEGRARGLAVHESFDSYVAQVAEVSVAGGRVRVHRVVCAVDCGVCVNPAGVEAQMQGGIVFGLTAALYGELTLKDGRVQQSNFHDYPLLRMKEMPEVEVHIVPSTREAGRRRRAGRAADRAGGRQRRLRRDGKAAAPAAVAAGLRRRAMKTSLTSAVLAVLSRGAERSCSRPPPPAAPPVSKSEGLAAFETVRAVLQHPRCQNCHIPGDAPLQFDAGLIHGQNVVRGPAGRECPACPAPRATARERSGELGEHMPPGAPGWRLPPPERKMVFIHLSSGELCRHLKDKQGNHNIGLEALLRHVSDDKLVLWGWSPGVGREPVSVPHEEFVSKFKTWIAAGAPCGRSGQNGITAGPPARGPSTLRTSSPIAGPTSRATASSLPVQPQDAGGCPSSSWPTRGQPDPGNGSADKGMRRACAKGMHGGMGSVLK